MRRNDARAALRAAREWEQKGMFKPGAFAHIEKTLGPEADEGSPSLAMQSFYAIGGVMLGAATAALWGLLDLNNVLTGDHSAWFFFLIFAILFGGISVATRMTGQHELGDALAIATLVPTAILMGPTPVWEWLYFTPVLLSGAVLAWRHQAHLVPLLALGVLCFAIPIAFFQTIGSEWWFNDRASWAWLISAALVLAGTIAWTRMQELKWEMEGLGATTLAAAIAWINVVAEVIQPTFDGGYEAIIAIGLAILIGVGVLLKERVIIFVSGIAMAIDAIVFAFDIGGPTTGLLVLLGMAGGLIAVATWLRRRKGQTPVPV